MNCDTIQKLLQSVSRSSGPFVSLRCLDGTAIPSRTKKVVQKKSGDLTIPSGNEDELGFCFLCEKVLSTKHINTDTFEFDFLLRYFPTDRELCTVLHYCSICFVIIKELKELHGTIVQASKDLDKLVSGIRKVIEIRRERDKKKMCEIEMVQSNQETELDIPSIKVESEYTVSLNLSEVEHCQSDSDLVKDKISDHNEPKTENGSVPNPDVMFGNREIEECIVLHPMFDYNFPSEENTIPLKRTYSCQICNEKFSSVYAFDKHCKLFHPGVLHHCLICGKKVSCYYRLDIHIRIRHTKEMKPFKCSSCGKEFEQMYHLKKHRKTHSKSNESSKCKGQRTQTLKFPDHVGQKKFPISS